MDGLSATKSECVGLIVRVISFQDFQVMWSWSTNVTDGRTDRRTTCNRNTALCTKVHRAVKTKYDRGLPICLSRKYLLHFFYIHHVKRSYYARKSMDSCNLQHVSWLSVHVKHSWCLVHCVTHARLFVSKTDNNIIIMWFNEIHSKGHKYL